jgi:hypothetical protein
MNAHLHRAVAPGDSSKPVLRAIDDLLSAVA